MAKFRIVGIDAAIKDIDKIGLDVDGIAKMCVYDGAGIVADAVKRNINNLPVRDPKAHGKSLRGATPAEKEALAKGFGVASMRVDGSNVNTVLGFDGYDNNPTKKYPKGHAISMIARTIESGSSWLNKTPFLKPAFNSSKSAAEEAMAARFDKEISKRGK